MSLQKSNVDITKRNRDRRLTEYWLQEALEASLYHRFCAGPAESRALLLHGRRRDGLADFALLDANREIVLFEVKPQLRTPKQAREAVDQLAKYVAKYEAEPLATHATRYCQHHVGVASWFEYGGAYSLRNPAELEHAKPGSREDHDYGRLVREGQHNFYVYREGAEDPEAAWTMFLQDYEHIVGATLDGATPSDHSKVARCILLSDALPDGVELGDAAGVPVEFWRYVPLADWVSPAESTSG